jgi:DNA topoisomerase-1
MLGADVDGEAIEATHGRYGPYLKKGSDSRSLDNDAQLFTVTLDQARALFAQPKPGRAGARSAAPLRELGPDPVSGQPVTVKEGRFGPYVTDGVTNASLRKGDTIEAVSIERAAELLANRREAAPRTVRKAGAAKKTAARKTVAKKTAATKTAATKTAATKTAAKKTVAKKTVAKKTVARKAGATKAVAKKTGAAGKTAVKKATAAKKAPRAS